MIRRIFQRRSVVAMDFNLVIWQVRISIFYPCHGGKVQNGGCCQASFACKPFVERQLLFIRGEGQEMNNQPQLAVAIVAWYLRNPSQRWCSRSPTEHFKNLTDYSFPAPNYCIVDRVWCASARQCSQFLLDEIALTDERHRTAIAAYDKSLGIWLGQECVISAALLV